MFAPQSLEGMDSLKCQTESSRRSASDQEWTREVELGCLPQQADWRTSQQSSTLCFGVRSMA